MTSYSKASDLIKRGESAVALFTRGSNFHIGRAGLGSTGDWDLSGKRAEKVDSILLYLRTKSGVELWRGRNLGLEKRGPRWKVKLADLELLGNTDKNWREFTGGGKGGRQEIRYVTRS